MGFITLSIRWRLDAEVGSALRLSLVFERLTAAVSNVEDVHRFFLNREENSVYVGRVAIQQLAHFKRESGVFGS